MKEDFLPLRKLPNGFQTLTLPPSFLQPPLPHHQPSVVRHHSTSNNRAATFSSSPKSSLHLPGVNSPRENGIPPQLRLECTRQPPPPPCRYRTANPQTPNFAEERLPTTTIFRSKSHRRRHSHKLFHESQKEGFSKYSSFSTNKGIHHFRSKFVHSSNNDILNVNSSFNASYSVSIGIPQNFINILELKPSILGPRPSILGPHPSALSPGSALPSNRKTTLANVKSGILNKTSHTHMFSSSTKHRRVPIESVMFIDTNVTHKSIQTKTETICPALIRAKRDREEGPFIFSIACDLPFKKTKKTNEYSKYSLKEVDGIDLQFQFTNSKTLENIASQTVRTKRVRDDDILLLTSFFPMEKKRKFTSIIHEVVSQPNVIPSIGSKKLEVDVKVGFSLIEESSQRHDLDIREVKHNDVMEIANGTSDQSLFNLHSTPRKKRHSIRKDIKNEEEEQFFDANQSECTEWDYQDFDFEDAYDDLFVDEDEITPPTMDFEVALGDTNGSGKRKRKVGPLVIEAEMQVTTERCSKKPKPAPFRDHGADQIIHPLEIKVMAINPQNNLAKEWSFIFDAGLEWQSMKKATARSFPFDPGLEWNSKRASQVGDATWTQGTRGVVMRIYSFNLEVAPQQQLLSKFGNLYTPHANEFINFVEDNACAMCHLNCISKLLVVTCNLSSISTKTFVFSRSVIDNFKKCWISLDTDHEIYILVCSCHLRKSIRLLLLIFECHSKFLMQLSNAYAQENTFQQLTSIVRSMRSTWATRKLQALDDGNFFCFNRLPLFYIMCNVYFSISPSIGVLVVLLVVSEL